MTDPPSVPQNVVSKVQSRLPSPLPHYTTNSPARADTDHAESSEYLPSRSLLRVTNPDLEETPNRVQRINSSSSKASLVMESQTMEQYQSSGAELHSDREFPGQTEWRNRVPDFASDTGGTPFDEALSAPSRVPGPVPFQRPLSMSDFDQENPQNNDLSLPTFPGLLPLNIFVSPVQFVPQKNYGVVRVDNIPYSATIAEIVQLVERFARGRTLIPHVLGFPVHIIIERATGKTLEAYVELISEDDARKCIILSDQARMKGEAIKIGQRHVTIRLSDQGKLMAALFPRPKCIVWHAKTGTPRLVPNEDSSSEGFRGLFTIEEITNLVQQALHPNRMQFGSRCYQRVYENMISILYKFPWAAVDLYSPAARNFLFSSYMAQLRKLCASVYPGQYLDPNGGQAERLVGLNHQLLMDFMFAGLNVECFSLHQRYQIRAFLNETGDGVPLPQYARDWPFQCLTANRGMTELQVFSGIDALNEGYKILTGLSLTSNYHDVLNTRLQGSRLICELTENGTQLTFAKVVQVEHELMAEIIAHWEKVLSKGRSGALAQIAAPPLQPEIHEAFGPQLQQVEDQFRLLLASGHIIDRNRSLTHEFGHLPHTSGVVDGGAGDRRIDPTTPAFVPSRPWVGNHGRAQPASHTQTGQAGYAFHPSAFQAPRMPGTFASQTLHNTNPFMNQAQQTMDMYASEPQQFSHPFDHHGGMPVNPYIDYMSLPVNPLLHAMSMGQLVMPPQGSHNFPFGAFVPGTAAEYAEYEQLETERGPSQVLRDHARFAAQSTVSGNQEPSSTSNWPNHAHRQVIGQDDPTWNASHVQDQDDAGGDAQGGVAIKSSDSEDDA